MPCPRAAPAAAALAAALCCGLAAAQAPGPNYYAGDQSLSLVSLAGARRRRRRRSCFAC